MYLQRPPPSPGCGAERPKQPVNEQDTGRSARVSRGREWLLLKRREGAVSRAGAAPNGCSEGPRTDSAQCSRWQGPRGNENTLYKQEDSLHGGYHVIYGTSTASDLSRPTRHERPAGAGPGGRASAAADWLRGAGPPLIGRKEAGQPPIGCEEPWPSPIG